MKPAVRFHPTSREPKPVSFVMLALDAAKLFGGCWFDATWGEIRKYLP